MGIAEAYWQYVDEDLEFDPETLAEWPETGLSEYVEGRVAALVQRWCLLNVYLRGGFERPETAKVARQVARSTCSWLMKVAEIQAYDWTYVNGTSLMPEENSEEYRELAHFAASMDLVAWLGRWREDALARMIWFCSISETALRGWSGSGGRAFRKQVNKISHAIDKEIQGVAHALKQDEAKPRRRKTADAEEE